MIPYDSTSAAHLLRQVNNACRHPSRLTDDKIDRWTSTRQLTGTFVLNILYSPTDNWIRLACIVQSDRCSGCRNLIGKADRDQTGRQIFRKASRDAGGQAERLACR